MEPRRVPCGRMNLSLQFCRASIEYLVVLVALAGLGVAPSPFTSCTWSSSRKGDGDGAQTMRQAAHRWIQEPRTQALRWGIDGADNAAALMCLAVIRAPHPTKKSTPRPSPMTRWRECGAEPPQRYLVDWMCCRARDYRAQSDKRRGA